MSTPLFVTTLLDKPAVAPARLGVRLAAFALVLFLATSLVAQDRYHDARMQMVREVIEAEGIESPRVLEAMRTTPRHEFVRGSLRHLAYSDQALDIGSKQTISPPFIVAYMTEVLDPQPEDKVLEIGTGSGYQAAVLAPLVDEVYTIEIVKELGERAATVLKRLGYNNVHVKVGDGYLGWPEHAPFDKIIVTCSPENVPQPLVEQLREGGRMIIPLGERYQQVFHLFEKREGKLVSERLIPTLFVPMTGRSEELRQVKPDPLHPALRNGGFEELLEEQPAHWHYLRAARLVDEDSSEGERHLCFENDQRGRAGHALQGMAIDGRGVAALDVSLRLMSRDIRFGRSSGEQPALVVHYFDDQRRPIGMATMGPWLTDSKSWKKLSKRLPVPATAREAILRVGLNGATGTLCIDDISLTPVPLERGSR